jgi:alkylhydroperoxidase family enzyme
MLQTHELDAETRRLLERLVPPPYSPPLLYLEIAKNREVARCFAEGPIAGYRGLLHTGQITAADRELCILRVTARRGAAHEWGVHVAYFGRSSGLTPSQVKATAAPDAEPDPRWSARQRAILAIADAVADCRGLTGAEEERIQGSLTESERTEFVTLASLYLAIAAMCIVFRVPIQPGTPALPRAAPGRDQADPGTTGGDVEIIPA